MFRNIVLVVIMLFSAEATMKLTTKVQVECNEYDSFNFHVQIYEIDELTSNDLVASFNFSNPWGHQQNYAFTAFPTDDGFELVPDLELMYQVQHDCTTSREMVDLCVENPRIGTVGYTEGGHERIDQGRWILHDNYIQQASRW